ncbi:N-lysine methyltransferase KMT5A [Dissostichus eleginoides]|uniref:N-lysine methyltransferase KMT5A n=1 Tax=Dissostichus eleginoides TaxID=100907 RepID=A0AAD9EXY6_DISEL|nr:N-lysine methyltransferase KMT5A [Dissostichus eleginoides]
MAVLRRRKPPLTDAIEHASEAVDKTAKLEVMYINSFKGRGVFATSHFQKGDFVVEYRGELIHSEESQRRRRIYHVSCAVFMFDFYWQERTWCVDAAQEDSSLGRLVNDDHKHPNCKMKKVVAENKPHLCLFALRDINPGEEITYDYGGTDWPWRKQVGEQATAIESSEAEIPSTSEPAPQRSSISDTQHLGETESYLLKKKDGMMVSLVNYTDSDESQSPSRIAIHDDSSQAWNPGTDIELKEDKDIFPRLRRTKSIQMTSQIEFDSDELFDPSSADIGEEYIPKTRLFNKKLLWRHMKICKFKPDVPQKPGKTRVQALSAFAVPPPPGVKIEFWKLLNNMVQDDVYIAVKSDVCIMEYGEHLYHRLGYDVGKHEYIRQKLRELGRLLQCSKHWICSSAHGRNVGFLRRTFTCFARPSAFTCYRSSDCLRYFAKACGAKNPESLTSTKLRKQTGTLFQVLNLTNTELDLLADSLGHDIRVHRQFYRLPEGTLQLAKISKLLMALEQGRLAEFQGKTLDDISIDPEENVRMDSDNETVCESDSQEGQVTSTQMENETTMTDGSNTDEASQQGPMTPPPAAQPQTQRRQKGRQPFKKKLWEKTAIQAVEKHMMTFINTCRVPRKSDCDKCLEMEGEALKQRNWLAIKFYIKNRITALKSKM